MNDPANLYSSINPTGSRHTLCSLSVSQKQTLLGFYHERVHCLYSILHWPTFLADLRSIDYEMSDNTKVRTRSLRALEASVYFLALCSITDDDAWALDSEHRPLLLDHYRRVTENLLSAAGLYKQPNLTTLQAFSMYVVSGCTGECLTRDRVLIQEARAASLQQLCNRVDTTCRRCQTRPCLTTWARKREAGCSIRASDAPKIMASYRRT